MKMMKCFKRSNLDEMQELKLLKIESKGFWIGFFGLALVIAVQTFVYGRNVSITLGEFAVLFCMGIYLMGGCIHNGIWDRHLSPTPTVNLCASLLAALVTALYNSIYCYYNYQDTPGAFITFGISFLLVGVVLFTVLSVTTALYHKKKRQLEEETPDENKE